MWHVIAEENLICNECRHDIPAGAECLSQMPVDMPEKFSRCSYQNFCITCTKCELKEVELPCYARRLDHWYTVRKTTEQSVRCGHCDQTIAERTRTVAQKIYAWPEAETESGAEVSSSLIGGAVAGAADGVAKSGSGAWHNLGNASKQKFRTAGLGGVRGIRTASEARHFYETSIPKIVRNGGESAVKEFLKGKQASHIKSVANAPNQARSASNVIWENANRNAARVGRNMSGSELSTAKSALRSSAINATLRTALKGAARGGFISLATEGPVAGVENYLHWKRGRKTGSKAAKDAISSSAITAGVGGAVGAAMVLTPLSLGPLGVPVTITSGVMLAGTSIYRVAKAAQHDLPLDELYIHFCKERNCKTEFAQALTNSASGDSPSDID